MLISLERLTVLSDFMKVLHHVHLSVDVPVHSCSASEPLCFLLNNPSPSQEEKTHSRKSTVKSISQLCFVSCRANTLPRRHKSSEISVTINHTHRFKSAVCLNLTQADVWKSGIMKTSRRLCGVPGVSDQRRSAPKLLQLLPAPPRRRSWMESDVLEVKRVKRRLNYMTAAPRVFITSYGFRISIFSGRNQHFVVFFPRNFFKTVALCCKTEAFVL